MEYHRRPDDGAITLGCPVPVFDTTTVHSEAAVEPAWRELVRSKTMLDAELLSSIARQLMNGTEVDVQGKRVPVRRTSKRRLKTVALEMDGRKYQAIEQNPEKPSRWGKLAREGHRVVQFKDVQSNRFVAVAVDGEAKEYGARRSGKK